MDPDTIELKNLSKSLPETCIRDDIVMIVKNLETSPNLSSSYIINNKRQCKS